MTQDLRTVPVRHLAYQPPEIGSGPDRMHGSPPRETGVTESERRAAEVRTVGQDAEDVRFLAGLLETAWPEDAERRAVQLLAAFGSVSAVFAAPAEALRRCLGPGDDGIASFVLSVRDALADRRAGEGEGPLLPSAEALADLLQLGAIRAGRVRTLYLNARNLLLADETVTDDLPPVGQLGPGTLLKRALELGATAIILVGRRDSLEADPRDLEETARLVRAAKTLDIVVHDRIFASPDGWRSFRQSGLLV